MSRAAILIEHLNNLEEDARENQWRSDQARRKAAPGYQAHMSARDKRGHDRAFGGRSIKSKVLAAGAVAAGGLLAYSGLR